MSECLPESKLDFCKMILCPNIGLTFHSTLHVSLYYSLFTVLCTFHTSWRAVNFYLFFHCIVCTSYVQCVLHFNTIGPNIGCALLHWHNALKLCSAFHWITIVNAMQFFTSTAMCRAQQWSHISAKQLLLLLGWHSIRLQKACPIFQHAIWTVRRRRRNMIMMQDDDVKWCVCKWLLIFQHTMQNIFEDDDQNEFYLKS